MLRKANYFIRLILNHFALLLAEAQGRLAEAQARLAKAQQDVARYKPLVEQNAISKEEYETSVSAEQAASASVDAARASVKDAELNLGYTKITSPIDGLVGKTQVKPGNLVGRGENTLLTVVSNIEFHSCAFQCKRT